MLLNQFKYCDKDEKVHTFSWNITFSQKETSKTHIFLEHHIFSKRISVTFQNDKSHQKELYSIAYGHHLDFEEIFILGKWERILKRNELLSI